MDWHDLAYFVCLVEHQTLTACAEQLSVQHSTVSRRIERLEQALSLTLFDRLGKRYILTQEGELLYAQAAEVQKEIVTFERMAIDQNAMQGSVIISAPPVLANEVLIAELPAFRERYPDIVLHVRGDIHFNDLYITYSSVCQKLGITILPYFLAAKNPALLPINPVDRTVMIMHEIVATASHAHIGKQAIPLVQSQPLYVVMHPDVRRSARVRVAAEWLGSVFGK